MNKVNDRNPCQCWLMFAAMAVAIMLLSSGCSTLTISSTGELSDCSEKNIARVTIPNSVTSIGKGAFSGCTSLKNVTIPDSVTSIGNSAFASCTRLTNITVAAGNSAYSSANGVLFNKAQTVLIAVPNGLGGSYTIPNSVKNIGDAEFSNCRSLTNIMVAADNSAYSSINGVLFNKAQTILIAFPAGLGGSYTIPDSVTSIGECAFFGCTRLASVTIPNSVTSIGCKAFDQCSGLTSVAIPNSVTNLGDFAFYRTSLTSVTIPNSVTTIGEGAFYGTRLTSVTIPNSVTSIDGFGDCTSLTNVIIPNSVTNIGQEAFQCTSLTSVTIPSSVTGIGIHAFASCTRLTSVTIPDSVTSIGKWAFANCTSLKSVTIPDGMTSIGLGVFAQSGLTSVTIPNSVTSIGDQAFQECASLTSVTIPDSVTSIGEWAFFRCTSLTSVTIPSSVTSIGKGAFADCSKLQQPSRNDDLSAPAKPNRTLAVLQALSAGATAASDSLSASRGSAPPAYTPPVSTTAPARSGSVQWVTCTTCGGTGINPIPKNPAPNFGHDPGEFYCETCKRTVQKHDHDTCPACKGKRGSNQFVR